jgi:HSP20 family protein
MYRSVFPRDVFADLDRLQRELFQAFEPGIRGIGRGGFPAMNVGSTPQSVELYAFVPGVDPAGIEVNIERGVLTVSGERSREFAESDEKRQLHINERFAGRFRRVVSLPDDIDVNSIKAECRDGVLHISARHSESSQPRRITIQ